jgi:hypothetical protein
VSLKKKLLVNIYVGAVFNLQESVVKKQIIGNKIQLLQKTLNYMSESCLNIDLMAQKILRKLNKRDAPKKKLVSSH